MACKIKPSISPRDTAILRYIWVLTEEERSKLDKFYLKKIPADVLDGLINAAETCDLLEDSGHNYEVILLQCEWKHIWSAKEAVISFRANVKSNCFIALVKPSTPQLAGEL